MSYWQKGEYMSTIENKELFEQYYQSEYDFNTMSLDRNEITEIKKYAREKRTDYGLAPMGTGVFDWILQQGEDIRFEKIKFDSDKIDGMLYIPTTGKERAYIILNANKPLINQIFTAAHEYYHYAKDYQEFKGKPYICDFTALKNVNEMRASRFAAELLLPEKALKDYVENSLNQDVATFKNLDFDKTAAVIMLITIKYQIPLKAVIYRLYEEHYIDCIDDYIDNYDFIKRVLQNIEIFKKQVDELYGTENKYVIPYSSTYSDMEKAFLTGNASKEEILKDAEKLGLDINLIEDFLIQGDAEAEDEEDDILFSEINIEQG